MAIKYVNSGASGANNGTSWTDAWTALSSATTVAAGDEVRIHKTHTETFTVATTYNFTNGTAANPVKLFCVDKDASDVLATGAIFNQTVAGSLTFSGFIIVDGLTLTSNISTIILCGTTAGTEQIWYNSTFTNTSASAGAISTVGANNNQCILVNCTIDLTGTSSSTANISCTNTGGIAIIRGGTIKGRTAAATTSLINAAGGGVRFIVEGVDLSTNTVTNLGVVSPGGTLAFRRCKLPTFTNYLNTSPSTGCRQSSCLVESCTTGTISVPSLGLTSYITRQGTAQSDLTRYRTGGADDGQHPNPHCWAMASGAGALTLYSALECPPIERWVIPGSYTVTLYVASGVTLNNDEFWIEVLSPAEGGSPTTQSRYQTTKLANRGTNANLTTDGTSTWNGSGVGTKQKVSVSIAPAVAGPVSVRAYLAKATTTIYIDPTLDIA